MILINQDRQSYSCKKVGRLHCDDTRLTNFGIGYRYPIILVNFQFSRRMPGGFWLKIKKNEGHKAKFSSEWPGHGNSKSLTA